jgi:hypothetical protein
MDALSNPSWEGVVEGDEDRESVRQVPRTCANWCLGLVAQPLKARRVGGPLKARRVGGLVAVRYAPRPRTCLD